MKIRMTLTAIALSTMALAGCSNTMMADETVIVEPAASPIADPKSPIIANTATSGVTATQPIVVTQPASDTMMIKSTDNVMTIPEAASPIADPKSPIIVNNTPPAVTVSDVVEAGDALITAPASTNPVLVDPAASPIADPKSPIFASDAMMKKDDAMMMEKDAMMKDDMAAGDAAFNACFANGGQVVNFIGDPSGATMACETDGVQTIL